ncbi:MAG TPA: tetratricopeptide repeat protein [Chloroflexia bacterium]|nr:tetratricopeptide repeat protein [Chloroflexia bacterium]
MAEQTTDDGITFGGWLKQRRNELGLTQHELAQALSISHIMLVKIEAGQRRPSSQMAGMLADFLRLPDDEREAFLVFARAGRPVAQLPSDASATRHDDATLRAPWRNTYAHRTNLPTPLTPLVGRDTDVAAVQNQLNQPSTRLLTLTGSPGIGKTRLALQVALGLVGQFDDGVYLVELAHVSDPDLVLPTIAQTLGLREFGGLEIGEQLRQYVQGRRMLLVLDNFEQVLDAAQLIMWLMEPSPWLKVLTTSREALHVRGEKRFPVQPLALPDVAQTEDLQSLAENPSVRLFVERARAVQPDFTLTPGNAQSVASICTRLEGLPLAIELAAARSGLFPPEAVLARLGRRLDLLTGGARDLPERQRTLRGTIEWSYDLLNEREQNLFRKLAVFVGGSTVEAVQALYDTEGDLATTDTLSALQSLIDKSLVGVSEGSREKQGLAREPRFTMLETITEYAFERLRENAEAEVIQERHALYVLGLLEEVEPRLLGPEQIAWLNKLDMEHDNIRAALTWALESKAAEIGLRLVGALRWFWTQRSHYTEGLRWAKAIVTMRGTEPRNAARARALWSAGVLAWLQGDPEVRPFIEESVSIWREVGDKRGLGHALHILGMATLQQGQPQMAHAIQLETVAVFRAAGDKLGLSLALPVLSNIMLALEDAGASDYHVGYGRHRALLEEAIQLARETGGMWVLALQLRGLGLIALRQGEYAEARSLFQESLALHWEMGTKHEAAATVADLGQLAQLEGDLEAAAELYEKSLGLFRECADKHGMVNTMAAVGGVALRLGDTSRAVDVLTTALEMVRDLGSLRYSLVALGALGWLMACLGQPARAAVLLSAVEAHYEAHHFLHPVAARMESERYRESARARVDEDTWQQEWARGSGMSVEQALQFASQSLTLIGG